MAEEINVPDVPNDGVNDLAQQSEFIAPASTGVNLYKPITPPAFDINRLNFNDKASVSNPALRIKDTTQGSAPYHPKKITSNETEQYGGLKGIFDDLRAQISQNVDKNAYSKVYAYDASPKGAHKARYKAYGQETYDKVGFSPEIDNETWFNANTTMYDDWKRMATHAAWPMMKLGFMSPIKSYGKLFGQGDIGQDIAEARDYEEYNAIGYSTKGGIGGFSVNLFNSAAYSVGILTEAVVEGALIGAAVGAVGGEGVGAAPGAIIGGAFEGIGALAKLPSTLFNMSKNLGKMTMNLKKLENLSEVKNVFSNTGRAMGNFINPISNTSEAAMKYVFKNPDDLSNLARTARTAGAMWHDVKNINAALSEGRLEGGFTEQRVYDELYNKYYDKYDVAPSDELQKEMRKQAKVAGFQNTWKNTLLVNYSNKIAFPSITRAGFMKALPTYSKTLGKVGPYQIIFDPAKKAASELAYTAEKISLRNAAKALVKPATYGKTALNYFKANLVEGFQESAQDVLANATEEYYINSFKNKDRQNFDYSMATLNAAMKKQISWQGAETFASGFAMGTILGIPGGVKDYLSVGYNKYFKHRNNYDEYIKEREGDVKEVVDALNTMDKGAKYFFDPRMNNYVTQMLVGKVADDPEGSTTKEARDSSFAGFQSAVRTSLRTGTFDMFIKNFEGYKQASPQDIEDAWRLEPGQGQKALEYIDSAVATAKDIAARWQYAKKKFQHIVDPNQFKENTPEREMAEIYNQAYLTGLDNLVFMGSAYDNNAQRLNKMYSKMSSIPTIQNSRFSDIASITDPERLDKEIAMLRTEVEAGKTSTTPEGKEQYEKQKQTLEKLETYQKSQNAATIDFLKRIITKQVELINANPNISKQEAQRQAVDQVVEEYKTENYDPISDYKNSFKSLLDTLAGSEDNIVKLDRELDEAGGIDNLFEMLMDTHLLRNENRNLNKFINILNDPKEFSEHIQRNFEWMKKLYNNRQDYYDEVVKNSLSAIQRNTLLEELADKGIYVDLEEFAEWTNDMSKLPTYFIDQVNQRIINQDSYLYDKYIELFDLAEGAEVQNPIIPKKEVDEKLQAIINDYNGQREGELETALNTYNKNLKEVLGYTQEEIDKMRNEVMGDEELSPEAASEKLSLAEKALEQLKSDNIVDVQAVLELAQEEGMVTAMEYNMAREDLYSNENALEEVANIAQRFQDVEEDDAINAASDIYILTPILQNKIEQYRRLSEGAALTEIPEYENTQVYDDYQKELSTINEKYDRLIDEATAEAERAAKADIDAKRTPEMKKAIQEVKDMLVGSEDIVQTKRNYVVDGEPHERMSNRIKSGYDVYGYTGEEGLIDVYDKTIGAALGAKPITISEGTITIKPGATETFAQSYVFTVKDGKIVDGDYYSFFQGEYKDVKKEEKITNPEKKYNELSVFYSDDQITVKGTPITKDVEAERAEVKRLEKELFEKSIPLKNWTSVEHGKYVTLLGLRGDVEKRDLLRNLEPSDSWQLYAVETLSEEEAKEVLNNVTTDAKADIELPKTKDSINDTPILKSTASNFETLYIPRRVYELAYENDEINKTRSGGPQSLERIIQRGGYTIEELNKLLPRWKEVADIEKTEYGTLSGSRPLSEIIGEDAKYYDLGNNVFAVVFENGKIAAIVDKNYEINGKYIAEKAFGKDGKFNSPNEKNVELIAKANNQDVALRIQRLNQATEKLNAELDALESEPISQTQEKAPVKRELDQALIDEFITALVAADLPGVNTNKYTVDIVRDELETIIAPKGTRLTKKTQKNISNLKAQIAEIDTKIDSTKDKARLETLKRQKAELESTLKGEEAGEFQPVVELNNDSIKSFVLNTVKENAYEESRDAGNIIDPMLKDYLDTETSVKPEFNPEDMSKEAYDGLFDDQTGYLTQIKNMADAGEIFIFTKNLYVHANDLVDENGNKLPPVAGEIDMIIVDKKGNKYIVDLKTGKLRKWLNYKTIGSKSYEKQLENTMQQTGYANLAEHMSGDKYTTMIFPIEIEFDNKGFIIKAGKPTNPSLFVGEEILAGEGSTPFTIKLDKGNIIQVKKEDTGVYENISIDQLMQRLIPVKGKKPGQIKNKPTPQKAIPENEREIVDDFMAKVAAAGKTDTAKEEVEQDQNARFDELMDLGIQLDTLKPTLSAESYTMLKNQLDITMSLIFDNTGDIVLKPGEIYIFTEPVKSEKITKGYTVKINTIDPENGTVTVSRVGPGRKKEITMSIIDFNKYAMSQEEINNTPKQEEYVPTQEEIDILTESMDVTNTELSDFEQLAQWEESASADDVSIDDLENNFLNNIKCQTK